jgi:hypothetical protein
MARLRRVRERRKDVVARRTAGEKLILDISFEYSGGST